MKRSRFFRLSLFLLLAALLLCACSSERTEEDAPDGGMLFEGEDYSFYYDEAWATDLARMGGRGVRGCCLFLFHGLLFFVGGVALIPPADIIRYVIKIIGPRMRGGCGRREVTKG